jgi:ubiquinone/menaquinone biosynthesis C-methylase UbiE
VARRTGERGVTVIAVDFDDPAQRKVFFDVHHGLPREGPGSRACTRRALELVGPISTDPHVLDIGCGPGMQTMDLADLLPRARITAVDIRPRFVEEARRRAHWGGATKRVDVIEADMAKLPFAPNSFNIVWSEGAAYIMGIREALEAWAPLLRNNGRIAITEVAWLRPDVPVAVRSGWEHDYPAMTDVEGCRARVREAGLQLIGDFVLPESAWWADYYHPMEARLDKLAKVYAGNPVGEHILALHRDEITMYREFSAYYGYVFLVIKR